MAEAEPERALLRRIAAAMELAGVGQNELARQLKTSASTVHGWLDLDSEATPRIPGGRHLLRLPGILKVDGHWLLTGDGDPRPPDPEVAERAYRGISTIVHMVEKDPSLLDRVLSGLTDWDRLKRSVGADGSGQDGDGPDPPP